MTNEKPDAAGTPGVSVPPVVVDPAAFTVVQHSDDRPMESRDRP